MNLQHPGASLESAMVGLDQVQVKRSKDFRRGHVRESQETCLLGCFPILQREQGAWGEGASQHQEFFVNKDTTD